MKRIIRARQEELKKKGVRTTRGAENKGSTSSNFAKRTKTCVTEKDRRPAENKNKPGVGEKNNLVSQIPKGVVKRKRFAPTKW